MTGLNFLATARSQNQFPWKMNMTRRYTYFVQFLCNCYMILSMCLPHGIYGHLDKMILQFLRPVRYRCQRRTLSKKSI